MREYYCGNCGKLYKDEYKAANCCSKEKANNPRIKHCIYGSKQLEELTKEDKLNW